MVWLIRNLLLTACMLLIIEISGQFYFRIKQGEFLYQKNLKVRELFYEHPYLSIALKKNQQIQVLNTSVTTNESGFRITSPEETAQASHQTVVVCLGGSTTFGSFVNDEESWPYLLQEALGEGYKVYNLGAPGYSTLESIVQMTTLVPELKPDIILNFQGWNDIHNYHIPEPTPDYYWHGMLLKRGLRTGVMENNYLNHSTLFYYTRRFHNNFAIVAADGNPVPKVSSYTTPDPYEDSLYLRNLKTLQVLGTHQGAKVIFIPQILNAEHFAHSDFPSRSWTLHIRDEAMPKLLARFNQLMISHIKEDEHTLVLDHLADQKSWGPQYFVDDGHFNVAGGLKLVKAIVPAIRSVTLKDSLLANGRDKHINLKK